MASDFSSFSHMQCTFKTDLSVKEFRVMVISREAVVFTKLSFYSTDVFTILPN